MEQESPEWVIADVNFENLYNEAFGVIELVLAKNQDYGDAWQRHGLAGLLVRLSDKALRVDKLWGGQQALVVNEGVEDTLKDMVGYALLGLIYVNQLKHQGTNRQLQRKIRLS